MRHLKLALLYASLAVMANGALAADPAALEALRDGDMKKLTVHAAPMPGSDTPFLAEDGTETTLAAYAGQVVVLNFWATWCAPCREEMPDLDALNAEFGGEDFAVVPIASGRNGLAGIRAFYAQEGIETLPILLDPQGQLSRRAGVLGLPVTVLMDRQGREIARLQGAAHWNAEEARRIIEAAIAAQ